jgi:DNA-binding ferritin-like protein
MPLDRTNGSTLALVVTGALAVGSLVRRGSAAGSGRGYISLQDARDVVTNADFSKGKTEVWYMLPDFFLNGSMGYNWLAEQGNLPTKTTLTETHAHLGSVAEKDKEVLWMALQGENWSPRGEARDMISSRGLRHTSMSMGDVLVVDDRAYIADSVGFEALPISIRDLKGSRAIPPHSPMGLERFSEAAVGGSREFLLDVLAHLRAQHWDFWTTHWQVHGQSFYGDHLLFQRLYTGPLNDQIDQLGEKMTAFFGGEAVESMKVLDRARALVGTWAKTEDPYERAIVSEQSLQAAIMRAVMWMREHHTITLGMDDYLMSLANQHETNLYLLQQRVLKAGE